MLEIRCIGASRVEMFILKAQICVLLQTRALAQGGFSGLSRIDLLRLEYKVSTQKNNFWHKTKPKKIIFDPIYPKVLKSVSQICGKVL